MPSIEAVEQFKRLVLSLASEPEIRVKMGLPPEEVSPPSSAISDDLADLLGGMPGLEPDADSTADSEFESDSEPETEAEAEAEALDDLFSVPDVGSPEADGPSLDDLLGPALTEPPEEPLELDAVEDLDALEDVPASDDSQLPEVPTFADALDEDLPEELGEDLLADMDFGPGGNADLDEPEADAFLAPAATKSASREGVSPDQLSDEFFNTPGEDLYSFGASEPEAPAATEDEEFVFGDGGADMDFPELAGFADTKEEDVEAFDAMGEADEFQLGDFESQFGITADDHTDADLLNPAQSVDLEIEAAQKNLSLTDDEFTKIGRTLAALPLNLRLAVEELIGEKDIVFDDLDKVVRMLIQQAPARTLAATVGKLLGRKILIPPGFEKLSGEEIEARHSTLGYSIRTIMLPILRIAVGLTAVAAALIVLGWNFLYKPLKASDLYDKGLEQVRQNNGVRADELFQQAYYYWPAQDRFFQYAQAYENSGDFARARRKYYELLRPTIHPYVDQDKVHLAKEFQSALGPLPANLEGSELVQRLNQRNEVADRYYDLVFRLLSQAPGSDTDIRGEVIFQNPDVPGLLRLSEFETNYGFDGRSLEAHFRRAEAALVPILSKDATHKAALLRRGDNYLAWAQATSTGEPLEAANSAFSQYMQSYGKDEVITWRFVKLFLLEDDQKEILALKNQIFQDKKMAMDGETMAQLAQWLIDKEWALREGGPTKPVLKTLEEEYGLRPKHPVEAVAEKAEGHKAAIEVARSEGGGHGGGEAKKEGAAAPFLPPYKYPYSSQPYRPPYSENVDQLLLRALDAQKEIPELHYQLARFYRLNRRLDDEKRALAAADTYFQRLEPRKLRLNKRPALRVQTLNRIGEIFTVLDQPLQAEQYFLEAQRYLDGALRQNLVSLDPTTAVVYRNLGDLYYLQTPGTDAAGKPAGGWDQALALYEQAEKGKVLDPVITYRKGVIFYERQEFGSAVREFFQLDQTGGFRTNWNLLYAMANALFRNGNFFAAEGYYREVLGLLLTKRSHIAELDIVKQKSHRALMARTLEAWNNLGATLYRGATTYHAGSREFREALRALTTAQAMVQILGTDFYSSKAELDITAVDEAKQQAIRDEQGLIIAKTRQERGLVEANLKVLSLLETVAPSRRNDLSQELEIFTRLPLELEQAEAP